MRPEIAEADRRFAVRRAAAAWQRAGAASAEARRQIDLLHRDDRRRTGGWFRLLLFVFTLIGAAGAFGLLELLLDPIDWPPLAWSALLLVLAGGVGAATETLLGSLRLRRFGVEEATGWLAIGFATSGGGLALLDVAGSARTHSVLVTLSLAVAAGLAGRRWGLPLTGAASAAGLFLAMAVLPGGRWWWLLVAPPLAWALERVAESPRVSPAERARAREAWWVALAALFVAVHVESVERWWLAEWASNVYGGVPQDPAAAPSPAALALSWAAMVALSAFLVGGGVATGRRARLDAGLLAAAATVVTAVDRLDPRPLWPVPLAGGLALVALALLLRRRFRLAADHILAGWTSEPLFDDADRAAALELAGAAAALSPPARDVPPEPDFEGEGGEFGGGGASGRF